jgi:hypothetical protein
MNSSPQRWSARCLLVLAAAAPLVAQTASGTVVGFDGKPAAAAVRAFDGAGALLDETLASADGAFTLATVAPIARLEAQLDAVIVELRADGGRADGVALSFATVATTTVRGSVVDPGGAPAAGRDLVFRDRAGKAIATATLDANGSFAMRTNVALHDAVLDPLGWRHVVAGPFAAEREATIDLREQREKFFRLRGRVCDDAGKPGDGWLVWANGERKRAASATAGPDGTFTLWCNQPVASIEAHATIPRVGRLGPWRADAELALDERKDALVMVCGRFVDGDGKPCARALLIPCATEAAPHGVAAVGATDRDGRFAVRLIAGTPFLFAVSAGEKATALARVPTDGTPLVLRGR